jgi:sec-independent protein translocase protein TatA
MGSMSWIHWMVVILVVLLLFGRNKIKDLMADTAEGIKAFKKGMADDEAKVEPPKVDPVKTIDHQAATPVTPQAETRKAG